MIKEYQIELIFKAYYAIMKMKNNILALGELEKQAS